MAITIRLRRDTAANWTSNNPTLALGEPGIETDTAKIKYGDDSTAWNDLPYSGGSGGSTVYAGKASLSSGAATVSASWATTDSIIVVTPTSAPGVPGSTLYVSNIVASTSFDISSEDITDSRDVFWIATESTGPSGFAMEADATASDAYVIKDLGSNQAEVWLTFECGFTQAARDFWDIGSSGVFGGMLDGSDAFLCGPDLNATLHWTDQGYGGEGSNSPPSVLTFHLCELHFIAADQTVELFVDSSMIYSGTNGPSANQVRKIVAGQYFSVNGANSVAYIQNVKAGTTRGASDLFADDFSSMDLSNWDSTVGSCSVINSPF